MKHKNIFLILLTMISILISYSLTSAAPYDTYTKALMHFEGVNGSQTITEETGKTITTYGNTSINTSIARFCNSSVFLDGNGDYLSIPYSTDMEFISGDYTIEFWFFKTRLKNYNTEGADGLFLAAEVGTGANGSSALLLTDSGATTIWWAEHYGTTAYNKSIYVPLNQWNHIAFVRSGISRTVYLNGQSLGTESTGPYVSSTSAPFLIGTGTTWGSAYPNVWAPRPDNWSFIGSIDEFRISKGIARWTTNFALPSSAYGDPVTGVTLDQSNLTLITGGVSKPLTATILPSNATTKVVTWSTSDSNIATVVGNGLTVTVNPAIGLTATKTANITVTTQDGGKTATCTVTVNPSANTSSGSRMVFKIIKGIPFEEFIYDALVTATTVNNGITATPVSYTDTDSGSVFKYTKLTGTVTSSGGNDSSKPIVFGGQLIIFKVINPPTLSSIASVIFQ